MPLLQSFATIILGILVAYFVLVNVLDIPFTKDLVKSPGDITKHLTIDKLNSLPESDEISLNEVEESLRKTFSPTDRFRSAEDKLTNKLPPSLVPQVLYDQSPLDIKPSNDILYEKDADFGSDRTNISQYVSSNPSAFYGDLKNTAYVPDVNVWNEQGSKMYNDLINMRPNNTLNAFNYENPYSSLLNSP